MEEKKSKKFNNSFHLRVYDLELLKSLNELFDTGRYDSMNELINCALNIGIEKLYLEFGKRKLFNRAIPIPEMPDGKKIDKLDGKIERLRILVEDMYILMNSIEAMSATVLNVQRAELSDEPVNAELIDSGYLAQLPPAYLAIKDGLMARFDRKLKEEKKPE